MHDRWLDMVRRAVKGRHEEMRAIRGEIRAWVANPEMAQFAKEARLRYLRSKLRDATKRFGKNREIYIRLKQLDAPQYYLDLKLNRADNLIKEMRGYEMSIDILEGKREESDQITEEMIERAREFPIENILEVGANRRAKCVFHGGEDFNMDIRKNYGHCYVCGESGDVLTVYMKLHDCGFREAVLRLNNS